MPRRPKYVLKVKVEGPGVHKKAIAVPDLLKICDAIQTAVHRQAESMQKPSSLTLRRGPITAIAQEECTLELFGLTSGSTGLQFRYAKPQQRFHLPHTTDLGTEVLTAVAETIRGFEPRREPPAEVDVGVLDSLNELGEVFERKSITRITLKVPRSNGRTHITKATFDAASRKRVIARVKTPTQARLTIEGRLEMADFKEAGKQCRIHPTIGLPVQCTFDSSQEDLIYDALRKPVRLTGTARLNPNNNRTEELKIETVEILDEMLLGAKDFFASRSLEQLANAQGVHPLTNPKDLVGGWPADEDTEEFIGTVYRSRG